MDKVLILNTYNSIKPISNQEPKTLNIKIVSKKLSSIPKEALVSTFLVANAFVWYLSGFSYLQAATTSHFVGNSLLLIEVINFASLVSSAFIISSVTNRFKSRRFFLKYWVLAGVLLSFLFVVVNFADFASLLFLAIIIGVYFGIGMPICMGYFAKTTVSQNRAKLGRNNNSFNGFRLFADFDNREQRNYPFGRFFGCFANSWLDFYFFY